MRFALRAYRAEDFQTLWEIDQSCFTRDMAYSRYELRTYIRRLQAFTIVAEETWQESAMPQAHSGRILGFLVGERSPGGRGHIITIDVREHGRRHGIGTALLHAAEAKVGEAGCASIRLETAVNNIGALSFYKRHGYNVVRTVPRYYDDGLDALVLEKILVSSSLVSHKDLH